jgi:hypothetical protein
MKPKPWNTVRIALYGGLAGVAYSAINFGLGFHTPNVHESDLLAAAVGEFIGGAVGGAALCAAVSGIRNYFGR